MRLTYYELLPWMFGVILLLALAVVFIFLAYVRGRKLRKMMLVRNEFMNEENRRFEEWAHWYKAILDAVPVPISVVDKDKRWTFINRAVESHISATRDDVIGRECNLWNDEICKTPACGVECALRGEKRIFYTVGDKSYQVDVEILRNMQNEVSGFIEVVQDITNIKQLTKERAEADIANKAKTSFLANMSHEIRTPMNAILGVTEILLQKEISPEIEEGLDKIYNSCDLLLGIINDILDFSKIEAGKMDIVPVVYPISGLINDAIQLNMLRIGDKPIKFQLDIDEKIPIFLIGDEIRIKQILNNLISNAIKYTESGEVRFSIACAPGDTSDSIMLMLGVGDTGVGMSEEQLEALYDEYTRFNEGTHRTIEGTGLGLTITRTLVNLMGGTINVQSEPNVGTEFMVMFPQGVKDSTELGEEATEALKELRTNFMNNRRKWQIVRDPITHGRVLLVDDVETNLYVASGLLKLYDLQVESVMSGPQAIAKIENGNVYDLIFMDHMMPEMDGIETTRLLRDKGYTAPIIALTANAVTGQADVFLQNGFDDFVSKPIHIKELDRVLNTWIRDKYPKEAPIAAGGVDPASIIVSQPDNALLISFIGDTRKAVALLEEITATAQWTDDAAALRNYSVAVHGMKSALWNIGEKAASEEAKFLENAMLTADMDYILANTDSFLVTMRRLIDVYTQKMQINNKNEDDSAALREKLLAVSEKCADYDRKGALGILTNINTPCEQAKETLARIQEYVINSDFEEAEALAKGCLKIKE